MARWPTLPHSGFSIWSYRLTSKVASGAGGQCTGPLEHPGGTRKREPVAEWRTDDLDSNRQAAFSPSERDRDARGADQRPGATEHWVAGEAEPQRWDPG